MKRIGILSDTHSWIDDKILDHLKECDEIWHAGDIGDFNVIDKLKEIAPVKAVCGNIDGGLIRTEYSENLRFLCEGIDVWMTHIGGYPGRYNKLVKKEIHHNPPKLFVSGHSHILKVMYDEKLELLHINPGAAGKSGFHKVRTLIRLIIDGEEMKDLEVVEMGARGKL